MYNDLLLDRLAAFNVDTEEENDARIQTLIEEIEELDNLLSPKARELIEDLRPRTVTDDVYDDLAESDSFLDRLSDHMAAYAGSWFFIGFFALMMAIWMGVNAYLGRNAFDPYPFILLNLGLSTLAALQAPVILMSQNRQADKDRAVAHNDYEINLKNELEIADLHRKMDFLTGHIEMQNRLINALVVARRQEVSATIHSIEQARKVQG